jgi:hypothetical protein
MSSIPKTCVITVVIAHDVFGLLDIIYKGAVIAHDVFGLLDVIYKGVVMVITHVFGLLDITYMGINNVK